MSTIGSTISTIVVTRTWTVSCDGMQTKTVSFGDFARVLDVCIQSHCRTECRKIIVHVGAPNVSLQCMVNIAKYMTDGHTHTMISIGIVNFFNFPSCDHGCAVTM